MRLSKVILSSWVLVSLLSGCLPGSGGVGGGGAAGVTAPASGASSPSGDGASEGVSAPADGDGDAGGSEFRRYDAPMAYRGLDGAAIDPRAEVERIKGGFAMYERAEASPSGLDLTLSPTTPDAVMIFGADAPRDVRFLIKLVYVDAGGFETYRPPMQRGQARLVYTPFDDDSLGAKRYFDANLVLPTAPDGGLVEGPNVVFENTTLAKPGSLKLYYACKRDADGACQTVTPTGPTGQSFAGQAEFDAFEADADFGFIGNIGVVFPSEEVYRIQRSLDGVKPYLGTPRLPLPR